ncbi:MAG: DNA gyrase subunit A [Deltaproteobacteria bacterium]|nr:DNA gyrase subunit A [Deltaproteobacteria bacterium]
MDSTDTPNGTPPSPGTPGASPPPPSPPGTPSLPPPPPDDTPTISIEREMRNSYLDYAMSVIIGRAIPDVRDGLKPVHRRILYAMYEMKNFHNQAYKKSARIVGDVIGKYHPHGDSAVYDALVRMAQDFSMRQVLVDGQGNFGSMDGDPPAAMRYTEVRLHRLASELLEDLEKETVEWGSNYDDSLQEPLVLPAKFPNLLANGSSGIAVGMATNIPPHNLGEVIAATIRLIREPDVPDDDLFALIPGPDFPTGGIICGTAGVLQAARTGRGSIIVRGRARIEEHPKTGRETIVVTEIPFQVNKAKLVEKIAELAREKRVVGISDLRDESDRDGIRVVVELKREAVGQVVLNQLFKLTPLQTSFGVINLSIVDGRPRVLSVRDTLLRFIEHRRIVVTRRCRFELAQAEAQAHILEGLVTAIDHIDEVIAVIRASPTTPEARTRLMEKFALSERQAQAILDMRLARLTGLEREKILAELAALRAEIDRLRAILADDKLLDALIVKELEQVAAAHATPRRTEIIPEVGDIDLEDIIQREDMVVTISHQGFIKRNAAHQYRAQRRGGKGVSGMDVREEDFVRDLFVASTHDHVLFFSDRGRVYAKKVYDVPEGGRAAKGRAIVNFVGMEPDEKVAAILPVGTFAEGRFVVTASRKGYVKKTPLPEYASSARQKGIVGLVLDDDDQLVAATLTLGTGDILLGTRDGMVIRFPEGQVRPMGRASRGVRGINLSEGDVVVSMESVRSGGVAEAGEGGEVEAAEDVEAGAPPGAAEPAGEGEGGEPAADPCAERPDSAAAPAASEPEDPTTAVLTLCANGYGKRTLVGEYRSQNRGGKGLIDIKTTDRNGSVIGQLLVRECDHIMLISDAGTVLRCRVREISCIGRNTQGVRITRLGENEHIVAVEKLAEASEEGNSMPPPPEPGDGGGAAGAAGDGTPPPAGGTNGAEE